MFQAAGGADRFEGKMSKFGNQLIREGLISPEQLAEATHMRSLYGGRLGSNLVELGFVHADSMSDVLGRVTGFPVATQAMFDEITDEALALVPAEMAERLECVPLRKDGRRLHVAMAQPENLASTDALSFRTGLRIVPYVALELRLKHAQESKYGIANTERSVGLQSRERLVEQARKTAPPVSKPPVATSTSTPAAVAAKSTPPPLPREWGAPAVKTSAVEPARVQSLPPLDAQGAVEALRTASSRDEMAEAILRFGTGLSDTVFLFQVRDGQAYGWKGRAPSLIPKSLEAVKIPLSAPSLFQAVVESQRPSQGAVADQDTVGELYQSLKRRPPASTVVVPVVMRGQVVNLVYAENVAEPAKAIELLAAIALHMVAAYERLVREARNAVK